MRSFIHRFKPILLYILTASLMLACSYTLTEEEEAFLEDAEEYIIDTFPEEIPVYVYRFVNVTTNSNVQYLEKAIPDMLISYLKPIEMEYANVDFYEFEFEMSDNFKDLVLVSNSMFSNYITNKLELTTNFTYEFTTNSNFQQLVYGESSDDTNYWEELWDITTNITATNVMMTNVDYIPDEMYITLITNEFPDLTNSLSALPVVLINEYSNDFVLTNMERITFAIYGDYNVDYNPFGPSEITVNLYITDLLTSTNTNTLTNTLVSTEDELSYDIADFLKVIRNKILNQQSGDLYITTKPAYSSIYIDGVFIGQSPLFYPEVEEGIHQFAFTKEDYERKVMEGEVISDMTNVMEIELTKKSAGGVVEVVADHSNAIVFLDAEYIGKSPQTLSNLSLNERHRLMVKPVDEVLYPFYYSFTLSNESQTMKINPAFYDYVGQPKDKKARAWWLAYGNWGAALALLGAHVYADSRHQYYLDLTEVYTNGYEYAAYSAKSVEFDYMANTFLYIMVIETIVAAGFTVHALKQEDIYMGFYLDGDKTMAAIQFEF